jgi:hypothetical protein
MNRNLTAPDQHIGLFRIRGDEHRDLILAQCSFWSFVRRETDVTGEYLAISAQFEEARSGQLTPLYEWEIRYGRATARRIHAL